MKKITKAILLEILPLFIMGNFFFVFLLLLDQIVKLAELIFVHSIPLILTVQTVIYYLPSFLVITIPVSALLSVLLAFSRFSADSELVAMQACGASGFFFIKPVLLFGIASMLFGIYLSAVLLPKGSALAVENLNRMIENLSINNVREKEMYTDINGIIFYANKKIDNTNFEEIIMIDNNEKAIVSAQKGSIRPNANRSLIIQFNNGRFTMKDKNQTYTNLTFGKLSVNFPINLKIEQFPMNERLMNLDDLRKNFNTAPIYKYEFWKRFSVPFSAIIMGLLGLSFGVFLRRSDKAIGIVLSCGVALAFNVLFIVGETFVGKYNPTLLAWMPVIIFSLFLSPALYKYIR
ncbi:MAG: LptF/LptG family permease [Deferribacteraceae bacterium]|jgi:lipopolysaccharide export system permease protein|nr:LptF/LptG family permease [Deferribacteraceae bacterium]